MVVTINGKRHWLWRAVDNEGEVLDFLVQTRRNAMGASYAEKYGMNICSIRLTGVVVPKLVDTLVALLHEDEETWARVPTPMPEDLPVETSYDIKRYRDYIDARDAARLFRAALQRNNTGYAIYNGGAEDTLVPYPTLDFVEKVDGSLPEIRDEVRFRDDVRASPLSSARARSELEWASQYTWHAEAKERWQGGRRSAGR